MITKHWKISLRKNGVPAMLFTTTTDDLVNQDLEGAVSESLIQMARQYHRHPQTMEQNHRDLAIGAIMTFATEPPYDRRDCHIELTSSVPDTEPINRIGEGPRKPFLRIWEEMDASEDFDEENSGR